jgi:hypothetical protein
MKLELDLEEARWLFAAAGNYGRVTREEASKGGDWWAQCMAREQDVVRVWRKLQKFAKKTGAREFQLGPDRENGTPWMAELTFEDEERDGVFWVCLAALDPRTPLKENVGVSEVLVWPIIRKICRERAMLKELKVTERKRIKIDDDPAVAEELEKAKV